MVEGKPKGSALRTFAEFAVVIIVALALAWCITTFVVQPYEIPSESMLETIQVEDRVLSEKITYRFNDPQPGDIVTFHSVEDWDTILIKRVIAVGGQTVDFVDGDGYVYVDGKRLDEPYTLGKPSLDRDSGVDYPYTVPEGEIWVMGDNRTNSSDSRVFGSVPVENLTGKAFARYWPIDRIGALS